MLNTWARRKIGQHIDRVALYAINRQIPDNGAERFECPVTLEEVLAETQVDRTRTTPPDRLTTAGEHRIHLKSRLGDIDCRVKVRPAEQEDAPLLLYHHGLAEYPYTSTWGRLLPRSKTIPAHAVAVQAPYHSNLIDPIRTGFSSTEHLYQMFAGSLRIMRFMQEQFAEQGAAYTVASGISWGGITSLLYEGIFGTARAVIPLFASPRLSQAMWDAAQMLGREIPIPREKLDAQLDFTPIYERIHQRKVFPVLGEHDLFFRFDAHKSIYEEESLLTLPMTHVGAMYLSNGAMREHLLNTLSWAAKQPA